MVHEGALEVLRQQLPAQAPQLFPVGPEGIGKLSAKAQALMRAELMPSRELGLIRPAASPIR